MVASNICVIGAGHVGCALAFDIAQSQPGRNVILRALKGHDGNVERIKKNNNTLEAMGKLTGRVSSIQVSKNFDEDVPFSSQEKIIVVTVPSQGHEVVLTELAKHNLRSSTVIFITGNGVAVQAAQKLNAKSYLDTPTAPYSSRLTAEGVVSFRGIKSRLQIGSIPAQLPIEEQAEIQSVFSMPLAWSSSVLAIFFSGLNGVVHVPAACLNMGWIESTNGDFYFYKDGMSSGVCNVIHSTDAERLAVAKAYGLNIQSALDTFNANYSDDAQSMREFAANAKAHNSTKGAQKRFLSQDVPFWLCLCSDLGKKAGVPTPFIDSLILLASNINNVDYRGNGRTLASLGLAGASKEEIGRAFTQMKAAPAASEKVNPWLTNASYQTKPLQRFSMIVSRTLRV